MPLSEVQLYGWGCRRVGGQRPGLFFEKKTWLVMRLSGAISPLEMQSAWHNKSRVMRFQSTLHNYRSPRGQEVGIYQWLSFTWHALHTCFMWKKTVYLFISIDDKIWTMKYIVGQKPRLPQQEIRQKLSGNLRPLNCWGFLAIKNSMRYNKPFKFSMYCHVCCMRYVSLWDRKPKMTPASLKGL